MSMTMIRFLFLVALAPSIAFAAPPEKPPAKREKPKREPRRSDADRCRKDSGCYGCRSGEPCDPNPR